MSNPFDTVSEWEELGDSQGPLSGGPQEFISGPPQHQYQPQQHVHAPQPQPQQYSTQGYQQVVDEFAEEMSHAEERLHKATLYREVIRGGMFDTANDPLAQEVESEFQEFARQRLSVLLGIGDSSVSAPGSSFSKEEINCLKALATKIMASAGLRTTAGVEQQPRENPRPRLRRPAQRSAPQVPQHQPQQPVPTRRPPPTPNPQVAASQGGPPDPKALPPDGAEVLRNGRRMRVKWTEVASPKEIPRGERGVRMPDGRIFWILYRDITPQAKAPGMGVPMPSFQQMAQVSAMQTSQALNNVNPALRGIANQVMS